MVVKKLVLLLYSFLDPRSWRRIEKALLSYEVNVISPAGSSGYSCEIGDHELCCVCLSELKEGGGEGVRTLPCLHRFHDECIERWLNGCRSTCPVCRFRMAEEERSEKRDDFTEEMVIWFSSFHVAGF